MTVYCIVLLYSTLRGHTCLLYYSRTLRHIDRQRLQHSLCIAQLLSDDRNSVLSRRTRQRERLNALRLSICLSVCLFVFLSVAKMQKRDFLKN